MRSPSSFLSLALGLVLAAAPAAQATVQDIRSSSVGPRTPATLAPVDDDLQPLLGQPVTGLTPGLQARFQTGLAVFNAPLTVGDGLGPIFNDNACGACHSQPAIGGSSSASVTRFGQAGPPFAPLDHLGGTLLQEASIDSPNCDEVVPPEATVIASRTTPHVFGAGLLESVPDAQIVVRANNPPAGVSGRVHWVSPVEGGPQRAGRFGWKGGVATVLTFSADAALNEMGLTNAFFPTENAPNGDAALLALCDTVADPEDFADAQGFTKVERFTDAQRLLAAPPQTPRSGMTGEVLFDQVGCTACHPSEPYTTSRSVAVGGLRDKRIKPYSDFLLHDMGSLGDGIVEGDASEQEMMTRALWGLAFRDTLLHDGSVTGGTFADNARNAISAHDGEGAASRDAFNMTLTTGQQDQVIDFLASLGQAEFDWETDNDVDFIDWFFLEPFFAGPLGPVSPDDDAAIADVKQDGDFDLRDFGYLQRAWTN